MFNMTLKSIRKGFSNIPGHMLPTELVEDDTEAFQMNDPFKREYKHEASLAIESSPCMSIVSASSVRRMDHGHLKFDKENEEILRFPLTTGPLTPPVSVYRDGALLYREALRLARKQSKQYQL